MSGENSVFIGRKPAMNYALAVIILFNQGAEEVVVKARGRAISKAADVVEIVRRRFLKDAVDVKKSEIGTETLGEEGRKQNVSTMEITLVKQ
ncbi:MAG: DNA-binding protein Alba [Candidatus Hodarchaeota archaeon]